MRVIKDFENNLVNMEDIEYSEGFAFPRGTDVHGADPTKVYVRVQTKQRHAELPKPQNLYQGVHCARGLALSDTTMICVPLSTRVLPVDLCVQASV